jgi:hypothetical protein
VAGFVETVQEYRDLGYQDWEIANRMGVSVRSFVRQLKRYKLPISALAHQMAEEARR